MAAAAGKLIVVSMLTTAPTTYTPFAALRQRSIQLNAQTIDITDAESTDLWRELLAGGGVKSATISGSGMFDGDAAMIKARTDFFTGALNMFRLLVPTFGTFEGSFAITSLEFSGGYDDAVANSITLESSGKPTFTAV